MRRSVYGSLAALSLLSLIGCGGFQKPTSTAVPAATLSSNSVVFGSQLLNTTSGTRTVTITNTGTSTLVLSSAVMSGAQVSEYTITTRANLPVSLAPNFAVNFDVTFTPTARGARNATLTLTHNASNSPETITFNGTGVAPAISVNGSSLNFGLHSVNADATSAPLVVSNTGDGDLIISSIGVSGTNSSDFQLSTSTPLTIHANSTANIMVAFKPSATGARAASLVFTDNTTSGAHEIAKLAGTGIEDGPVQFEDAAVLVSPDTVSAPSSYPATFSVNIVGSDTQFSAGATVANFGPGTTVSDGSSTGLPGGIGLIQVNSPTSATAQITLSQTAAPGPRTIVVQTGGHESLATFNIPVQAGGPVPHADVLGTAAVGTAVYLDASKSTLTGNTAMTAQAAEAATAASTASSAGLSFNWSLVQVPEGSAAALVNADSAQPSFVPDLHGTYVAQLDASDGATTNSTWVVVSTESSPPTANAGSDQFVQVGSVVYLDGSGSTDPDGDALTYAWTMISAPAGSTAALSDTTAVSPSFKVDVAGDYLYRLDVNDGHGNTSSDRVKITTNGTSPVAIAGANQKVALNSQAQLDGSASNDPDGDAITCAWQFLSKPSTSNAQLSVSSSSCSDKATFTPDQSGMYLVQLTVADGSGNSSAATTVVSTDQVPPIAKPGNRKNVGVGETVTLDGSASYDPDGDTLTYEWSVLSKPLNSEASIEPESVHPTFVADKAGDYVFQLTVSDGTYTSKPSTVLISAMPPAIQTTPSAIVFGNQNVSTTSDSWPILITNTGAGNLIVSSINLSGVNAADFAYTAPALPVTIAGGTSTTVNVTFSPSATGNRIASLTLTHNAGGSSIIPLSGTGTLPGISLNPSSLTFAAQVVDTASAPQTITITNTGTGKLSISNITVSGDNSSDFSFAPGTFPIVVAPGASTNVSVTFKPSAAGARTAMLDIYDNVHSTPELVSLTGTGNPPAPGEISLDPASTVAFGNQLVNTASNPVTVTIGNTGGGTIHITNISISGTDASSFLFDRAFSFPITIAVNTSTSFGVIFTPKTLLGKSAMLTITDDAMGSPHTLSLTGTGVAPAISPIAAVNFGNVNVGSTSSPVNVTITNPGTAPLHISALSFGGTNASDFSTTTVAPIVVAPNGGTATVAIRFSPKAVGTRAGTLLITDDADGSPHSATLTGTGVGIPLFMISPKSLDFGSISVDSTSPTQPLVITNTGTADLVIDHMVKTGANGGDFLYSVVGGPDFPQTVGPGMSLTVNVSFKPSAGGSRSATLVFQDASANTWGTVAVSGTGVAPAPQISLSPTSLTFPTTPTNIASAPLGVLVTNNGNADLTISGLAITGTNDSDFTVVQTAPIAVPKNGGTSTLSIIFKPTALGTRSATLEITNNAGNVTNKVTVSLTGTAQDLGRLNLQPATVGKDLELLAIGSVDVAPRSDLSITISSSDPTKLLLSPLSSDPNGANAGAASFVAVLPAGKGVNGAGFPAFWIQALASSGTAQITLSAAGYTSATSTITFTPSGFVLISPLGVGTDFTTQLNASDSTLTVSSAQLDANNNILVTDQKLRGGLTSSVTVTSATPATGTIGGSPVLFQGGGSTSATVTFHPVAIGTTQLGITQPPGFTAPTTGSKLTATVRSPAISLTPSVVGYNLEVAGSGSLNIAAPAGGLAVTISSNDSSKVLLSTDPLAAGAASITVTVPAGSVVLPTFYVQGLASSGTTTLTASGAGYSSGSASVLLNPSGFVLSSPSGGDFVTTSLSAPTTLTVTVWQLNASLAPVVVGQIRGGVSAQVQVTSGTPATGTILDGSLTFIGGDDSKTGIGFEPNPDCTTPCTSVLSISHTSDYATPVPGGQITATVNKPAVSLRLTQTTVGKNLQITASGALDIPAPTDLQVTITSNNPNVLLSASPTAQGSTSLNLTVFQGGGVNSIGFPSYYIQALGDTGTAQLTISASGFATTSATVSLAPSGFVIEGPNGIGGNFGVVLANGNVGLTVRAAVLNSSTLAPTLLYQPIRGGFSTIVDVSSSAPGVATLAGPPLTITSGNATGAVTLQPQAPGQTTITVTTPSGFTTPAYGNGFMVTVN